MRVFLFAIVAESEDAPFVPFFANRNAGLEDRNALSFAAGSKLVTQGRRRLVKLVTAQRGVVGTFGFAMEVRGRHA